MRFRLRPLPYPSNPEVIQRPFSYQKDGIWHTTNGYSRRDLVNLAKAALLADSAIGALSHQENGQDDE